MEDIDKSISINEVQIRLSTERWQHIVERHPELEGRRQSVLKALSDPNLVQQGDFGTVMAVKRVNGLYLVVVYRETGGEEGFVVTAYYARKLRRRAVLWKR